jgi:hypothetical protein
MDLEVPHRISNSEFPSTSCTFVFEKYGFEEQLITIFPEKSIYTSVSDGAIGNSPRSILFSG